MLRRMQPKISKAVKKNQTPNSCCIYTISIRLNEPEHKITGNKIVPIEISYAIICAPLLNAPKNAYLELLAHPASKIPYTPKDDNNKINKTLKSASK